jgi:toxin ParE1/3/4
LKRLRLVFSPLARTGIADIREGLLENAGFRIAAAAVGEVSARVDGLREWLLAGAGRPELGEDIRFWPAGRYVVYDAVRADRIEVLRVLHGARDRQAAFPLREKNPH